MAFRQTERARAGAWKARTATLPDAAKQPAPYIGRVGTARYDFCLPAEFADYTLLPEVRPSALALFAELGIPWHASVHGGPSNHLLSSQVQCVNALGQMVRDPSRLIRAFGDLLGTAEVLEIEPGRYLAFEYIGPEDFCARAARSRRTRGRHPRQDDRARPGAVQLRLGRQPHRPHLRDIAWRRGNAVLALGTAASLAQLIFART